MRWGWLVARMGGIELYRRCFVEAQGKEAIRETKMKIGK
jgi:hypothetical protein